MEFALAMPIVFVVLFAVFEFGLAFWRKQLLTSAVREGARAGIVATTPRPASSYITGKVTTYLTNVGLSDPPTPTCTGTCPCTKSGQTLTVTATYPTSLAVMTNLTTLFWGSTSLTASKTLSASVSMQCE